MLDLLYDRLVLQGVLDKSKRPYSFLRDTFFSRRVEHESEEFGLDIVRGGEQVAPYVHPVVGGKMLEKGGYTTRTFTPPEVSPMKVITPKDVEKRLAGEPINGRDSWEQRQQKLASQFLRELDESITRREEMQCAELLTTGSITVQGEGYPTSVIATWPTAAADKPYIDIGGADADKYWGGTKADILGDLIRAADRVEDNSNTTATIAILGAGAAAALRADQDLWKLMDNRRIDVGNLQTKRLSGGARYLGTLLDSGLELYTYRGTYKNASGVVTPYIPSNTVIIGSREAETSMNYGLVTMQDEERQTFYRISRDRVADSWMLERPKVGRIVQVKSRPLPLIRDVDAFYVMKVKAA